MTKFAVVTDSTAYIPLEYIKKHNITVAPQVLIGNNETLVSPGTVGLAFMFD